MNILYRRLPKGSGVDIIKKELIETAELDDLERAISSSPAADELRRAAASPEGQRVLRSLDTGKVEQAARSGDMEALKNILSGVLSTPEGQALARRIRKSMGK